MTNYNDIVAQEERTVSEKAISKLPPSDFSESTNMVTSKHNPLFNFYGL